MLKTRIIPESIESGTLVRCKKFFAPKYKLKCDVFLQVYKGFGFEEGRIYVIEEADHFEGLWLKTDEKQIVDEEKKETFRFKFALRIPGKERKAAGITENQLNEYFELVEVDGVADGR